MIKRKNTFSICVVIFCLIIGLFGTSPMLAGSCNQAIEDEIIAHFLQSVPPAPSYLDLNGDGLIDISDHSICAANWDAGSDNSGDTSAPSGEGGQGSSTSDESSTPSNGGMNISAYCQSIGYERADAPGDAYSWVCIRLGSQPQPVDMDSVCRQNYPNNSLPYAGLNNASDPSTWYCASSPQARPSTGSSSSSSSNSNSDQHPPSSNDEALSEVGYSSSPSGAWVQVVTGRLNIRSGPGVDFAAIAQSPNGRYFDYLGTDNSTGWHHVSWGTGSGWVSGRSQYTQIGEASTLGTNSKPSLGRGCIDNSDGTITCNAVGVLDGGVNFRSLSWDPFVGVFEIPANSGVESRIILVEFSGAFGAKRSTLNGSGCGGVSSFTDLYSNTTIYPKDNFILLSCPVPRIETAILENRQNPFFWALTYRKE